MIDWEHAALVIVLAHEMAWAQLPTWMKLTEWRVP